MRVLHVNCNYMTTALHQNMIEHLDKYTENAIFCPIGHGAKAVIKPNKNVKTDECFSKIDRAFYFVKQSKILESVQKAYDIKSFDIIHAYTLMTDGNCAMKLSEKYGIPYVVAVRDTDINVFFRYKPYLIPRAIKIMEKASRVFFLSEPYKNIMLQQYIPENKRAQFSKKMRIIPNGINEFWLNNRLEEDLALRKTIGDEVNVVFAGKLIKRKNIPTVQCAIDSLVRNGYKIKLTVVGDAIDKKVYDEVISDENTNYIPELSKEKLIEIYRKNDIFCMASLRETFGLVYAEAMTQGLPVLYTRGQGFDGQFPEGTVGYSIDCMNYKDIAAKIKLVIQNYGMLVKNSIEMSQKYSWEKITKEYDEVYTDILHKKDS